MRRRTRLALLAAVSVVALTGCITGERPTFSASPRVDTADDPPAANVLERLDRAPGLEFSATYDIIPSNTGVTVMATVTQVDGRREITIGDVTFVSEGGLQRTCVGDVCENFLDDARISDLNITHRFWGEAFASRLRLDSSRRTAFSQGSTETIAGHPAACVDVTVPGVVDIAEAVQYCALDAGVLARYFGADLTIELTSFSFAAVDGDIDL